VLFRSIVLLGAVIAAYAPSLDMRVVRHGSLPGWRLSLSLRLLQSLHQARAGERRGVSLAGLAETLRVDPLQLDPLIELLQQLDWVGRLEEAGEPRLVLLVEPATTPLAPLLDRLLLAPQPVNLALRRQFGWESVRLAEAWSDAK
jgi:membrane protein